MRAVTARRAGAGALLAAIVLAAAAVWAQDGSVPFRMTPADAPQGAPGTSAPTQPAPAAPAPPSSATAPSEGSEPAFGTLPLTVAPGIEVPPIDPAPIDPAPAVQAPAVQAPAAQAPAPQPPARQDPTAGGPAAGAPPTFGTLPLTVAPGAAAPAAPPAAQAPPARPPAAATGAPATPPQQGRSATRPAGAPVFSVAPGGQGNGTAIPPFEMGLEPPGVIVPNFVPESDIAPQVAAPAPAAEPQVRGRVDRPILPQPDLRLTGETDYVSLTAYLSAAEAARPATFSIGFVNSVLVMPEVSRLRISINGQAIIETAIRAPSEPRQVEAALPAGLLRPGANTVRIDAIQRHRVDCSLRATYELWTLLVPPMTGFSFEGGAPPIGALADLPAVGIDDDGATRIHVVPIGSPGTTRSARILTVSQAIGVMGRFEHPVIHLVDPAARIAPGPGALRVVVGPADAIREVTEIAAAEAAARPVVALMPEPRTGVATLVVSGPTQEDVDRALARFVVQAERSTREPPERAQRWHAPDIPLFRGGEQMTLGELGVTTQEFSGRRFQTHFSIALPPDFYAAAYGEAHLLLDAAFSSEVKPGSAIDIYVNSALAVTLNMVSEEGQLFRQRQVKIPLKSFRPGPNRISIEVNLSTDADARCLPGATMPGRERFVLFNTSVFRMASYARFGELPNLAAFAAGGFPYDGTVPTPVYIAGEGTPATAAAATLLARLSVSAGRPLPTRVASSAAEIEGGSAILVGSLADLGPQIIGETGLGGPLGAAWGTSRQVAPEQQPTQQRQEIDRYEQVLTRLRSLKAAPGDAASDRALPPGLPDLPVTEPEDLGLRDTTEIYDRWRSDLTGAGVSEALDRFLEWLRSSFGLTLDMIHLAQAENEIVRLQPQTSLVLAQIHAPTQGAWTWTVATAPTTAALLSGIEGITAPQTWRTVRGSVAGYQEGSGVVQDFTPAARYYVQTVPFSFENARLIAANWFSLNVLEYAVALILSAASLGIITWVLIRQIGREDIG